MKTNTKKKLRTYDKGELSKRHNYLRSKLPKGKVDSREMRYIQYHLKRI